ncbi:MAG: hypothetical protein JSV21_04675 [Nitrospirota bacterium]|nr:MAG: hypothetical protein JSV21_04675 [Nitrospirota bacterium]
MRYKPGVIFILSVLILLGCSDYSPSTGSYKAKGISLNFPAGWAKAATTPFSIITVENSVQSAQMNLVIQDLPENMTFEQFMQRVSSNQNRAGAREIDSGKIDMGGSEGHWSLREMNVQGHIFTAITYTALNDRKAYSVMGIAKKELFRDYESVFDAAAKSVRFVD